MCKSHGALCFQQALKNTTSFLQECDSCFYDSKETSCTLNPEKLSFDAQELCGLNNEFGFYFFDKFMSENPMLLYNYRYVLKRLLYMSGSHRQAQTSKHMQYSFLPYN